MKNSRSQAGQSPAEITSKSLAAAGTVGSDTVIIDTAGRLSIDQELMDELTKIKEAAQPREILLVADGMTGQEAVRIAADFNQALDLTGVILTKMEGDSRGGAAMSIRAVTKKPLKFLGVGEKLEALEPFHPERMASLILGMGDILSLIEKAQDVLDEKESEKLLAAMTKGEFTLDDFRKQMSQLKKIGSIENLLKMIPGIGKLKKLREAQPSQKEITLIEAIIDSMTIQERLHHKIIDASRRRRIAQGSGTSVAEVSRLLQSFSETRKVVFQLTSSKNIFRGLSNLFSKMR